MSERTATRRRMLQTAGGIAVLTLAGCSETSAPGTGTGESGGATSTEHQDEDDHSHDESDGGHSDGEESHGSHKHSSVPDSPSASAEVKMVTEGSSYHFNPHVVWVETGGTVTFVNESGSHSATAYAPENDKPRRIPEGGPAFDTGVLTESGATHEVSFDTPGVYDYYCIPHEGLGMIGCVIVGQPDAHDQPGLSEPTDVPESTHEKIRSLNDTVNEALGHTHGEDSESQTQTEETGRHEEGTSTDHHEG